MATRREAPRAVQRVMSLFVIIADQQKGGASLTELSERLECPKSSLLNLLRPLVEDRYLVQEGNLYYLGSAVFNFASKIIGNSRYTDLIKSHLEDLNLQTDETAVFASFDRTSALLNYVSIVESRQTIRYSASSGMTAPLHSTAVGRAVLAYFSLEELEDWLQAHETVWRKQKHFSLEELHAQTAEIRQQGYSYSGGPSASGAGGVTAPLFGRVGELIGVIFVGAPVDRTNQKKDLLVTKVVAAARSLSSAMGCINYDDLAKPERHG